MWLAKDCPALQPDGILVVLRCFMFIIIISVPRKDRIYTQEHFQKHGALSNYSGPLQGS